ncbi:glycoside hydrolase family 57 protein [Candidatus Saccharibacteria bacterium]|nr:glycoside hydrolase family 57 protein [Candidatus Saccharibacteria bacterium]MBQ7803000.1 glycoside hydrolase family 57 protein [Candidatus Saccharibacteria bacterium]
MRGICLYLHIHQPFRYRAYSIFDVGNSENYFSDPNYNSKQSNERIFRKVAEKSYYPTFDLLEKNLKKHEGFKFSLSITGVWLEQAETWAPDLIDRLKKMVKTGRVELVAETYYHSMSFFYDREEFKAQVSQQVKKFKDVFGVVPKVFRNTEFSYNDEVGKTVEELGFEACLAEGWDKILGWRSPNFVYKAAGTKNLKLLLKNYRLSDDIAFRFSNKEWKDWPLTVEKYERWVDDACLNGNVVNLFMDFETFGEHQWKETGIFEFMDRFIASWLGKFDNKFLTVSEEAKEKPVGEISMPWTVTWADTERDLSAWMGNKLQDEAMTALYSLREKVLKTKDKKLIDDFRKLTTSDHAYYMCTKYWNDGDVHAYFSAYDSPYDAFMYFLNILRSLEYRLDQ